MAITFLTIENVLAVHLNQVSLYGGDAATRDMGLLASAVGTAQAGFGGQWLHEFPHGIAAAYLFHIVSNHPFVDGNKRTGLASALAFLKLNGFRLEADRDPVYELVLQIATGQVQKSAVVEFFRKHVQAL